MRADGRADCAADDGHADTRTDCAADEVTNPSPYEVANPSTLAATERASFSDSDDRSIIRAHASTDSSTNAGPYSKLVPHWNLFTRSS